jgi:hypothetical protein
MESVQGFAWGLSAAGFEIFGGVDVQDFFAFVASGGLLRAGGFGILMRKSRFRTGPLEDLWNGLLLLLKKFA